MTAPDDLAKVMPQPRRTMLQVRGAYLDAFDALLAIARRELRVFDPDCCAARSQRARASRRAAPVSAGEPRQPSVRRRARSRAPQARVPAHARARGRSRALRSRSTRPRARRRARRTASCSADMEHFVRRPVAAQPRGVYCVNEYAGRAPDARALRRDLGELGPGDLGHDAGFVARESRESPHAAAILLTSGRTRGCAIS